MSQQKLQRRAMCSYCCLHSLYFAPRHAFYALIETAAFSVKPRKHQKRAKHVKLRFTHHSHISVITTHSSPLRTYSAIITTFAANRRNTHFARFSADFRKPAFSHKSPKQSRALTLVSSSKKVPQRNRRAVRSAHQPGRFHNEAHRGHG